MGAVSVGLRRGRETCWVARLVVQVMRGVFGEEEEVACTVQHGQACGGHLKDNPWTTPPTWVRWWDASQDEGHHRRGRHGQRVTSGPEQPTGSSRAEEGWGCGRWLHRVLSPASGPRGSCLTEVRGSELLKPLRLLTDGPARRQQNS